MFNIQTNYNLKTLNTFHFECHAKYFINIEDIEHIPSLIRYLSSLPQYNFYLQHNKVLILGGGSNLLFITKYYDGVVIKINDKKLNIIDNCNIKVNAGYNWHQFVLWCVQNNYYGIENLALIPGTVGAAPIQNIGAYGVEIEKYIDKIQVFNLETLQIEYLTNIQCKFAYRDSIFKQCKYYIILAVFFYFSNPSIRNNNINAKEYIPNISYKELSNYLFSHNLTPTPHNIVNSIINIRTNKLPNPDILGNAGSFFKNPIISKLHLKELLNKYPNIIYHNDTNDKVKLAAGWLIDNCGFKGKRINNVGVYEKQALILVNYNAQYGSELLPLINKIKQEVKNKFEIILEIEPTIIE